MSDLDPIVIHSEAVRSLYQRYRRYCERSLVENNSDAGWHLVKPRLVGFMYLDMLQLQEDQEQPDLIIAVKPSEDTYRVVVCYSDEQARQELERHAKPLGLEMDHYNMILSRAVLPETSDRQPIVIGEGESAPVAYQICLWIDVNRMYGLGRRYDDALTPAVRDALGATN